MSTIGSLLADQNQPELAIIFYKQSINLREAIRSGLRGLSTDLQQSYTDTVAADYRTLADLLLQQGRIPEALRVLDLLKVQELDEYLDGVRGNDNTRQGTGFHPAETAIIALHTDFTAESIQNLRQLRQLEDQKRNKIPLSPAEEALMRQFQQEQQQIFQDFNTWRLSDTVQNHLTALKVEDSVESERNLALIVLNQMQNNLRALNQDAVLLYPLILNDRLELVLVTPYGPPIRQTSTVSQADLNRLVGQLRYALEAPERDPLEAAQALYDLVLRPLEPALEAAGAKTIIYAPDRALRYLPLAVLHDGEQWAVERFAFHNITSASRDDLNIPPVSHQTVLGAAFSEGQYDIKVDEAIYPYAGLDFADDEVQAISNLATTTLLLNQDFSPAEVAAQANVHSILHLATHAQFEPGPPEHSFIVFGNGETKSLLDLEAGWLNIPDVDLVVLSACQTAVDGTIGNGAEILGFGYLMEQAGAKASLASLWKVNDGSTQVLMEQFYDALFRGGLSKAAALRQAQLSFINADSSRRGFKVVLNADGEPIDSDKLSHPFYWAPFILIGNGQ